MVANKNKASPNAKFFLFFFIKIVNQQQAKKTSNINIKLKI